MRDEDAFIIQGLARASTRWEACYYPFYESIIWWGFKEYLDSLIGILRN